MLKSCVQSFMSALTLLYVMMIPGAMCTGCLRVIRHFTRRAVMTGIAAGV